MKVYKPVFFTTNGNEYSIADKNTVYRYFLCYEGILNKNTKTLKNNTLPDKNPMNNSLNFRFNVTIQYNKSALGSYENAILTSK